MPEGSGVSRQQLTTFATKADVTANEMHGAVQTLDGQMSLLSAVSQGSFAAKFAQVKMEIQDELIVIKQALTATAADSNAAAAKFTAGDEDQAQQVNTVQASGLARGLPV